MFFEISKLFLCSLIFLIKSSFTVCVIHNCYIVTRVVGMCVCVELGVQVVIMCNTCGRYLKFLEIRFFLLLESF